MAGATPAAGPRVRAPDIAAALALVAVYLLTQILVGGALGLLRALLARGDLHVPRLAQAAAAWADSPAAIALIAVLSVGAAALVAAWIAHALWPSLWHRGSPPGFGLTRPQGGYRWWIAGLAVGLLMPVAGGFLTSLLARGEEVTQDVEELVLRVPAAWRLVLALLAVGVAPMIEELLFRGVLLSALIPRCGTWAGALLAALAFAAVHLPGLGWQWVALPALVALGLALAFLRLRLASLWPAVLAHAVNNAFALAVLLDPSRGS